MISIISLFIILRISVLLLSKLEVSTFEFHVVSRRNIKDETKIDMNQMSILIDQDVSVVSVLDLKNITDN